MTGSGGNPQCCLTALIVVVSSHQMRMCLVYVPDCHIEYDYCDKNITILHRGNRPLNNFDPYLVDMLVQNTRELGIDVRLQTKVQEIESSEANKAHDGRLMVHFSNTAYGEKQTMKADMVVHGACRVPEIDDLNLGAADVARENMKGIKVN
jgi:glutathione reductase (NADPH)